MSTPADNKPSQNRPAETTNAESFAAGRWVEIGAEELFPEVAESEEVQIPADDSEQKNHSVSSSAKDAQQAGEPQQAAAEPAAQEAVPPIKQALNQSSAVTSNQSDTGAAKPPEVSQASSRPQTATRTVRLERRQELEHHLKSNPIDLDSYMELGRIYRAEDRPADAKRVFHQAMQVFPDDTQLLWEHEEAVLARSLQQLREITDVAKRLDTMEGERELARSRDDWACRRMDVCRARLLRDPSATGLHVSLAEAMHDAGLYEGAIEELQKVIDRDEYSASANLIKGRCLFHMGKDLEAMVALRAAALRRAVVAPVRTRVVALRLLCQTAERLGVTLSLKLYQQHLEQAEIELAELNASPSGDDTRTVKSESNQV